MKPLIHTSSGNFIIAQYILMNDLDEILVEVRDNGSICIPGDYVLDDDAVDSHDYDSVAVSSVDRLLKSSLGISCDQKEHLCIGLHIEEDKQFNCHFVVCRGWNGDVPKRNKKDIRLMWVNRMFAKNLLTDAVDKDALEKLK